MNGSSRNEITHRQAFEWLQKERDGRLDEATRLRLNRHLDTCWQCRGDETFGLRLPGLLRGRSIVNSKRNAVYGSHKMVQTALRSRKNRRLWVQPVQAVGWAIMTLLIGLVMSWGIEWLKPGAAATSQDVTGWFVQSPPNTPDVFSVKSSGPWYVTWPEFLLLLAGFVVVLAALFLFFRRSPVGRLAVLLGGIAGSFGLFIYFAGSNVYQGNLYYALLFLPLIVLLLDLFFTYLWFNRRQWSLFTWLMLFFSMILLGVIVASAWFRSSLDISFDPWVLLVILLFSILPALIWQVLELPARLRWLKALISGVWFLGALLYLVTSYAANLRFPGWLETSAQLAGGLYPFFAATAAGWLIFTVLADRSISPLSLSLRLVAGLLLFVSLYSVIRMMAIETSTNEDPISGVVLIIFAVLGAVVGWFAMTQNLPRKRLLLGATLLAIFIAALVPATIFSADQSAGVTHQRAELINQAILRYHQAKGAYPPSLDVLSPGYLLLVPRPLANLTNDWCYVSGGDYYRLGYPYPTKFSYPGSTVIVELNGGDLPPGVSECEAARNRWIEDKH